MRVRLATLGAALLGLTIVSSVPASGEPPAAAPAPAAATTFTWSGATEAATGDARMSAPGNWAGGAAPAARQRVVLVFPPLACVAGGTCDRVVNDLAGLVADSIDVVQPGSPPPGPHVAQGGYRFTGEGVRLGRLTTSEDTSTGPSVHGIAWRIPVEVVASGATWRLDESVSLRAHVTGGPLVVRTGAAGLSVEPAAHVDVERFRLVGLDDRYVSSVYRGSVGDRDGTPVRLRHGNVDLTAAELGPLNTRAVRLSVSGPYFTGARVSRVAGDLRLDHATRLAFSQFRGRHAALAASGTLRLAGARLETHVDCSTGLTPGVALAYVRGTRVRGHVSDEDGDAIADGQVVRPTTTDLCDEGTRIRIRVDYTPTALRLTILQRR